METKVYSLGRLRAFLNILAGNPALLWLLLALAVRLLAGTVLHVYSVSRGLEGFYPLTSGADDRMYFSQAQLLLAGIIPEGIIFSYSYLLAAFFSVVGPSLIAGKLLSVVLGSLTVCIGVLIARELTAGRPYNRRDLRHPVNLTGLLLSLYPSAVFQSTQLLKDPVTVFLGLVAVYFILKIIKDNNGLIPWIGYGVALIFFYPFRPYAAFALAFGFILYLIYYRQKGAAVLASLFWALVAPWLTGYGPFAWGYVDAILNPTFISTFREEVYAIGGSAIGVTVDFSSIHGFLWTYSYSFLTAMFGPFVWQVRSPVVAIGLLEALPVLLLVPIWAKGIWRLLMRKEGSAGFLLLLSLLQVGAIALFSANIGANLRLRLLPWTVFLIYAALRLGQKRSQPEAKQEFLS